MRLLFSVVFRQPRVHDIDTVALHQRSFHVGLADAASRVVRHGQTSTCASDQREIPAAGLAERHCLNQPVGQDRRGQGFDAFGLVLVDVRDELRLGGWIVADGLAPEGREGQAGFDGLRAERVAWVVRRDDLD